MLIFCRIVKLSLDSSAQLAEIVVDLEAACRVDSTQATVVPVVVAPEGAVVSYMWPT